MQKFLRQSKLEQHIQRARTRIFQVDPGTPREVCQVMEDPCKSRLSEVTWVFWVGAGIYTSIHQLESNSFTSFLGSLRLEIKFLFFLNFFHLNLHVVHKHFIFCISKMDFQVASWHVLPVCCLLISQTSWKNDARTCAYFLQKKQFECNCKRKQETNIRQHNATPLGHNEQETHVQIPNEQWTCLTAWTYTCKKNYTKKQLTRKIKMADDMNM